MPTEENIAEAKSHLRIALVQVLPSDDKIIVEHVVQAYLALGGGLNDFLSERPFVTQGSRSEIGSSAASELCRHRLLPEWCEFCSAKEVKK
jgi:hypothetical protein